MVAMKWRTDLSAEIAAEVDRLTGIYQQRGADGLIQYVADELVKLRRREHEYPQFLDEALNSGDGSYRP